MNMKDPTSRLACWNLRLHDYGFDIIHRPGIQQTHVDCLIRLVRAINTGDFEGNGLPVPSFNQHNIREVQRAYSRLNQMIATLENRESIEQVFLDNDWILFRKDSLELSCWRREVFEQIVVTSSFVNEVLRSYHDAPFSAHQGSGKTFRKLKAFFLVNMRKDIENYCQSCETCQRIKGHGRCKPPLQPLTLITKKFEQVSMDIMCPLPVSMMGMKYVLVIINHLTRFVLVFTLEDQRAETVAKVFAEKVVLPFGAPKHLFTDRGMNFVS